jgi:hypothetical protein
MNKKMKNIAKTSYFLTITIGFCFFVLEMTSCKNDLKQNNTGTYFVDLPAGLDSIDFKAKITLDKSKQIHKIRFPNGGTETNVAIYNNDYLDHIQKNTIVKMKPLVEGDFKHDEEILLDISNLQPGIYYVHYLSCSLGGIFQLKIN